MGKILTANFSPDCRPHCAETAPSQFRILTPMIIEGITQERERDTADRSGGERCRIRSRLNVEHTAFLTKRETAKKYTRQVRQYINEQQMKREREKYRQKRLTQQRKKDTLE